MRLYERSPRPSPQEESLALSERIEAARRNYTHRLVPPQRCVGCALFRIHTASDHVVGSGYCVTLDIEVADGRKSLCPLWTEGK